VHDINKEFTNDSLIVHDSRGFQSGSSAEIETVNNFLKARAQCEDLSQQLHVIWFVFDTVSTLRILTVEGTALILDETGHLSRPTLNSSSASKNTNFKLRFC
jgi:hypothetical protein